MALGGGTWNYQDKILPGTYVNFTNPNMVSSGLSKRGTVAVPVSLNWGDEGEIIELNSDTIERDCLSKLAYEYNAPEMLCIRELFRNAKKVYLYRLGGNGAKAENIYARAKYSGTRGNALKISINQSLDKEGFFVVRTYLDNRLVDTQEVSSSEG